MTTNKVSGQVAFPVAGEGAYLQFTTEAFEKLESLYGASSEDGYINYIISKLAKASMPVYREVLACVLRDGDPKQFPWDQPIEATNIAILDALYLSLNGRTYEEQLRWNEEQTIKRMKGMQEDPQMAALLRAVSSIRSGSLESEQG